jgi:hypothetical protein
MKQIILFILCTSLVSSSLHSPTEFDIARYIEQLTQFCGKFGHMCSKDLFDFSNVYIKSKVLGTSNNLDDDMEKNFPENKIVDQDSDEEKIREKIEAQKKLQHKIERREKSRKMQSMAGLNNFFRMSI